MYFSQKINPEGEPAKVAQAPTSLKQALRGLEKDHEFLTEGDVCTDDVIEAYVAYKFDTEFAPEHLRPTARDFELYYDC